MKDLFRPQDGWSQADVAAVDDLLDALTQERAIIGTMWFRDGDEEWRLPRLCPTQPPPPMKTSRRTSRSPSEIDRRDFFIPTRWTKEQALLVYELFDNIAGQVWTYYLEQPGMIRFLSNKCAPAEAGGDGSLF